MTKKQNPKKKKPLIEGFKGPLVAHEAGRRERNSEELHKELVARWQEQQQEKRQREAFQDGVQTGLQKHLGELLKAQPVVASPEQQDRWRRQRQREWEEQQQQQEKEKQKAAEYELAQREARLREELEAKRAERNAKLKDLLTEAREQFQVEQRELEQAERFAEGNKLLQEIRETRQAEKEILEQQLTAERKMCLRVQDRTEKLREDKESWFEKKERLVEELGLKLELAVANTPIQKKLVLEMRQNPNATFEDLLKTFLQATHEEEQRNPFRKIKRKVN